MADRFGWLLLVMNGLVVCLLLWRVYVRRPQETHGMWVVVAVTRVREQLRSEICQLFNIPGTPRGARRV